MKINQIKIGVVLSYVQMALHIIIGLLYTPVMLRLLGQSEYGLYNTVSSTIATLGILSLGFGSSYVRYYSQYKKEDNEVKIKKLNGLFLIIFSVIGLISAICGIFLSFNLDIVFANGLTAVEFSKARILMLLLTFNLSMGFPMSVFSSIIGAHERFFFQKLTSSIHTVLSPILTLPLLLMGYGSVGLVTVSILLAVVSWSINIYYCFAKLKIGFDFKQMDFTLFKGLFVYSFFIALNMVVDQINWNVDKFILARFKGTSAVAVYSVGFSLYTYYQNFSTSISHVFTPRIHSIVANTEGDLVKREYYLTDIFVRVGRIQYIILGLISTGIIFFGRYFILNIWAGPEYKDSFAVALLLILPASIALIQNIGIEVQRAENNHKFRSIVYAVMALINLGISIVLAQRYGAIGSAIGTAISLILANGIIMNFYYQKRCCINVIHFWKEILRLSVGLVIPVMAGIMINRYILDSNIFIYFAKILIYCVVYGLSMWFLGMNSYEKNFVLKPIELILNKIKNNKGNNGA